MMNFTNIDSLVNLDNETMRRLEDAYIRRLQAQSHGNDTSCFAKFMRCVYYLPKKHICIFISLILTFFYLVSVTESGLLFGLILVALITIIVFIKQYAIQYSFEEQIRYPEWQQARRVVSVLGSIIAMRRLLNINVAAQQPQGVTDEERANMKIIKSQSTDPCCICLDTIALQSDVLEISCKHEFHISCFDNWISSNRTCPLCKKNVV